MVCVLPSQVTPMSKVFASCKTAIDNSNTKVLNVYNDDFDVNLNFLNLHMYLNVKYICPGGYPIFMLALPIIF